MSDMVSSEKTVKNREERKVETKRIACDVKLMRHLQSTRAPNVILDDVALRMEWSLHGGDTILFMQALVILQTKYMELKIVEEELEIISTKKKEALIDLESKSTELESKKSLASAELESKNSLASAELESKKKRNNDLELCAVAEKDGAIARKDGAIAEKDGIIARIKIELEFTKRKCNAELEKLTKKTTPYNQQTEVTRVNASH